MRGGKAGAPLRRGGSGGPAMSPAALNLGFRAPGCEFGYILYYYSFESDVNVGTKYDL